jgi:hypothetical protein
MAATSCSASRQIALAPHEKKRARSRWLRSANMEWVKVNKAADLATLYENNPISVEYNYGLIFVSNKYGNFRDNED